MISLNMWCSVQYVCGFFILSGYIFSVFFFIYIESPLPALLSIIIKAYSLGTSSCITTNILIRWFYCVHWIKPPFHKFPINDISPTYEIFFILYKLSFILYLIYIRYKLIFIILSFNDYYIPVISYNLFFIHSLHLWLLYNIQCSMPYQTLNIHIHIFDLNKLRIVIKFFL